jgi:hypothetical protein
MKKDDPPKKFSRVYEDDECISIWKYDLNKHPFGPIEVEYKWKKGVKTPKKPPNPPMKK